MGDAAEEAEQMKRLMEGKQTRFHDDAPGPKSRGIDGSARGGKAAAYAEPRPSMLAAGWAALAYGGSSTAIMVANKVTLTTWNFPSALFVALAQCVFAVVALEIFRAAGVVSYPTPSLANLRLVMPLPIIQVFNVGCGLMGTKFVSVPMFAVLRRVSIPLTLLAETYILGVPFSYGVAFSVFLLMLGAFVAAINDLSFHLVGYISIFISACATCAYGTVSKIKLSGPKKRTKWELLFYNSLASIPILCAGISARGHTHAIMSFPHWNAPLFLLSMALSTTLGLALNFAILYSNQINGPLATTITGSAKNGEYRVLPPAARLRDCD